MNPVAYRSPGTPSSGRTGNGPYPRMRWILALLVAGACAAPTAAFPAQAGKKIKYELDSGKRDNASARPEVVFQAIVESDGRSSVQIFFDKRTRLGEGSLIRLTSMQDGGVQHLTAPALETWHYSSAAFNGDTVQLELVAGPGTKGNRVVIDRLYVEEPSQVTYSLCGSDDRILSSDPRVARIFGGCTAWLINDCVLSAGHCEDNGDTKIEFNVPLSLPDGTIVHSAPEDQYPIDRSSTQFEKEPDLSAGSDWWYFGIGPSSETCREALQIQGSRFVLAANVHPPNGRQIRVTGYGKDSSPPEYEQVQQTAVGGYAGHSFYNPFVQLYAVDTEPGDSGAPIEDDVTGLALGIATHSGCTSTSGANQGTGIHLTALQAALRNPLTICADQSACNNDSICDSGEDCFNCAGDCGYAPAGGCGNDVCEIGAGEDCYTCPQDCNKENHGPQSQRYCCGNPEDCSEPRCTGDGNTCSDDATGHCCGDGVCEGPEDLATCGVDCGASCGPQGCDDGNPCTDDACVAGTCTHAAMDDNTVCMDGCDQGICCSGSCGAGPCPGTCQPHTICQASYCQGESIRCTWSGTCGSGNCCNYTCAFDESCAGVDPCPPSACSC